MVWIYYYVLARTSAIRKIGKSFRERKFKNPSAEAVEVSYLSPVKDAQLTVM